MLWNPRLAAMAAPQIVRSASDRPEDSPHDEDQSMNVFRYTTNRVFILLSILTAALLARPANAQAVTVTNFGCGGTRLSFTAITGAATYAVSIEEQLNCTVCGIASWYTTRTADVGSYPTTPLIVGRTPAFVGRWKVVGRNSAGSVVGSTLYSASGISHASSGAPYVTSVPSSRTVCIGSSVVLRASEFNNPGAYYQWRRNTIPIVGATGPTYTVTMQAADPASTVYECIVGNACEPLVTAPVTVFKGAANPLTEVSVQSYEERETMTTTFGPNSTCSVLTSSVVRSGACQASFASLAAGSLAANISNPTLASSDTRKDSTSELRFSVAEETTFAFTASSGPYIEGCPVPDRATVALTGPVSFSAALTTGESTDGQYVLVPGEYVLTLNLQNGDLGCRNCGTCGPSCVANCNCLRQAVSLTFEGRFVVTTACGSPNAASCCVVHDSPGCANAECCRNVCVIDPYCCDFQWDSLCVSETKANCTTCAGGTGDLNGDGVVNGVDLAELLSNWGLPGGDVNGDGTTDANDLAILLSNWS
jgi:hypothetical protein